MSDRPNQREYLTAEAGGESARRVGKPITKCPAYGNSPKAKILAEAWVNGWVRENDRRRVTS